MLKKFILLFFFIFLLILPSSAVAFSLQDFSQEEIIVKFKREISEAEAEKISKNLGARIFQKLLLPQTFVLKVPSHQVEKFVEIFKKNSFVEYVEPNFKAEILEPFTPNDPFYIQQWALPKIQAPQAWDLTLGSSSIKIAILDTGIDKTHEDLKNKVDRWINFTSSNTDDDLNGHGTHVAGIAAAATNNEIGIAGLGFNSHLLSVKVLDDSGSGYYSWIANGIKWAADNGAQVINLSLGGTSSSTTLKNALDYAWEKGVVLACAAGNSGKKSPIYPAYYSNCLATAATDENDQKASFSTYGSWVDVAAPGVNIYSTWKNNSYQTASGTSMAAPFVSGLAALIFGTDPTLSSSEVRQIIEDNTDKIAGTGTYWTKGRINVYKAITGIEGIALPTPTPTVSPSLFPSLTPIPTLTASPTPILTPIPSSTQTLSPTPNITPTPTPRPWWCSLFPWLCQ